MNKKVTVATLGIAAFSSSIFCSAFAEPVTRNTEFSVTVNPYLNVTLSSNDVHLPITPSSGGTFGSTYFTATASTNNALGYSLNLSIKDTNTAAAVLTTNLTSDTINVNDGTKPTIPTFSTNDVLTSAQFSASTSTDHLNHWAMSLNDTDHYQKVLSESTIATSDEPIADDVTTLNLATKLDLLTPPGSYSAYFNFEIVANVARDSIDDDGRYPANSLLRAYEIAYTKAGKPMYIETDDLTNYPIGWRPMTSSDTAAGKQVRFAIQDITMSFEENSQTKNVCEWARSSTADNSYIDEALVLDIRDGKSYFIAKTADDECWMTQNLDLVLSNNKTLTHVDTDLGWGTDTITTSWTPPVAAEPIVIDSDHDNWYSSTEPRSVEGGELWVGSSNSDSDDIGYNSFASCVAEFSDDTCKHYHIGNYYNWPAAVATSTLPTMSNYENAENSICPAGWRLPVGVDENDTIREVGTLLVSEGIVQDQTPYWSSGYETGGFLKIRSAPLYYVRGGDIYQNSNRGKLLKTGYYLNSTKMPYGPGCSYFAESYMNTASTCNSQEALSVRCVAR